MLRTVRADVKIQTTYDTWVEQWLHRRLLIGVTATAIMHNNNNDKGTCQQQAATYILTIDVV
jgi:hypothetical protein